MIRSSYHPVLGGAFAGIGAGGGGGSGEPVYNAGTDTAMVGPEDFTSYANTAELLAAYTTMEDEEGISLDLDGGKAGKRAMQITWLEQAQGPCEDDSHLIESSWPSTATEFYVTIELRYSSGFVFNWQSGVGGETCVGNAKKMFFAWSPTGSERWNFICENSFFGIGADVDPLFAQNVGGAAFTPADCADGNWHRFTFHIKRNSGPSTADGFMYGWIDGVQKWNITNWDSKQTSNNGWNLMKFPTTFNDGAPQVQYEWCDNFTIWTRP